MLRKTSNNPEERLCLKLKWHVLIPKNEQLLNEKNLVEEKDIQSLPCRENEFQEVFNYLKNSIFSNTGGCLYISGVPGTGKTETINLALRKLTLYFQALKNDLHGFRDFQVIRLNGLKLTDPKQIYFQLWKEIVQNSPKPVLGPANKSLEALEAYFDNKVLKEEAGKRTMKIVLVDEMDVLINKSQTIVYNLFEWPNRSFSNVILISIANTIDLPERFLSNKISSRLGLRRINFQPYTHVQLLKIMKSKLDKDVAAFDADALELAARKISAVSGDARKAIYICSRALELLRARSRGDTKGEPAKVIGMEAVFSILSEMMVVSNFSTIEKLSFHQKLFLISLIKCLAKNSSLIACLEEVMEWHWQFCRVYSFSYPNSSDLIRIALTLYACKYIFLEGTQAELYNKVRLNVSEDDVVRTLSQDPELGKLLANQ